MSKPSDRLILRLIEAWDLDPTVPLRVERTYAGYWQRSEGAFSWELVEAESGRAVGVGSQWTVRECANAPEWEWGPGGALVPVPFPEREAQ